MANEYEAVPLEDALIALFKADPVLGINGVVKGQIFPRQAPQNKPYPYLVVSCRAPRTATGNGGIEVLSTYPVLVSVYGNSTKQNAIFASKVKVLMTALPPTTLSGGSVLMGAVPDPRASASPGSGSDAQGNLVYSDNLSYLVFVQPSQFLQAA